MMIAMIMVHLMSRYQNSKKKRAERKKTEIVYTYIVFNVCQNSIVRKGLKEITDVYYLDVQELYFEESKKEKLLDMLEFFKNFCDSYYNYKYNNVKLTKEEMYRFILGDIRLINRYNPKYFGILNKFIHCTNWDTPSLYKFYWNRDKCK